MRPSILFAVGIAFECLLGMAQAGSEVLAWGTNNEGKQQFAAYSLPDSIRISDGVKLSPAGNFGGFVVGSNGRVVVFGDVSAVLSLPTGLSNVTDVASTFDHALALKQDGTVTAWGRNRFGKVTVPPGLTNISAVSVGFDSSFALNSDGTIIAWGMDRIPRGISNAVAISTSAEPFCNGRLALRHDGTVLEWRRQIGEATIRTGLSNVVAIAAGAVHNLALRRDGTVEAWGNNAYGETAVPAGLSNVVAIAAGGGNPGAGTGAGFSLALKKDGTVITWGRMGNQQATVPTGLSNVVAIAAGENYCLAITTNRAVADRFRKK